MPPRASEADSAALQATFSRFHTNWERAMKFFSNAMPTIDSAPEAELPNPELDNVRSGVVFLHATFEEFLRGIERNFLPRMPADALKGIAFPGENSERGPDKIVVAELTRFKGMTVDELISKSVETSLERSSYNSSSDVARFLQRLDFPTKPFRKYFIHFTFAMERRHRIVHNADFEGPNEMLPTGWTQVEFGKIAVAALATRAFIRQIGDGIHFCPSVDPAGTVNYADMPQLLHAGRVIARRSGLKFDADDFPNT